MSHNINRLIAFSSISKIKTIHFVFKIITCLIFYYKNFKYILPLLISKTNHDGYLVFTIRVNEKSTRFSIHGYMDENHGYDLIDVLL